MILAAHVLICCLSTAGFGMVTWFLYYTTKFYESKIKVFDARSDIKHTIKLLAVWSTFCQSSPSFFALRASYSEWH